MDLVDSLISHADYHGQVLLLCASLPKDHELMAALYSRISHPVGINSAIKDQDRFDMCIQALVGSYCAGQLTKEKMQLKCQKEQNDVFRRLARGSEVVRDISASFQMPEGIEKWDFLNIQHHLVMWKLFQFAGMRVVGSDEWVWPMLFEHAKASEMSEEFAYLVAHVVMGETVYGLIPKMYDDQQIKLLKRCMAYCLKLENTEAVAELKLALRSVGVQFCISDAKFQKLLLEQPIVPEGFGQAYANYHMTWAKFVLSVLQY
jgi:hypothetical protein